jgi:prepilin-type N-terminal cleavage/methylation domain-containing protein
MLCVSGVKIRLLVQNLADVARSAPINVVFVSRKSQADDGLNEDSQCGPSMNARDGTRTNHFGMSEMNIMEQFLESEHNQVEPRSGWQKVIARRKKERGYLLVELLIALTVVAILATLAAPSILGLQMAANNSFAWNTVSSVYFTGRALAVCQALGNSCPQLVMPSDGTWQQAGLYLHL